MHIIFITAAVISAIIIGCEIICDGGRIVEQLLSLTGYYKRPWEYKHPRGYKYLPRRITVLKKFPQKPPHVLTFNYRKRSGEEGKRTIHVRQVFEYRSLYSGRESYLIKGYCTTHNAERTFNDYRIRNLIDMQTGQIYDIGREFVLPIFHAWYEKNQKRKILRLRYWLLNKRGQIGNLPIIHKFSTGIRRLRHRSYDYDEW